MDYSESPQARHILVQAASGDALPDDLVLALEVAEVGVGRLQGSGVLRSAELVVATMGGQARRTLQGVAELVSLTGSFAKAGGRLDLWATVAFETDFGHEVVAGRLVGATVERLEVLVIALDGPGRAPPAPPPREPTAAAPMGSPTPPAATSSFGGGGTASEPNAPPIPVTRYRSSQSDADEYPEPGDLVSHFHFGECTVVESDGERIRLRQGPDGRVREVALSMLRIDAPTIHPETGKKHFELRRKN